MKSFDDWIKSKPFRNVDFNNPNWLNEMLNIAYDEGAVNKLIEIAESVSIQVKETEEH